MKNLTAKPFRVSLFGASPDTGNQGVNALHDATLDSLASREIKSASVFGYTAAERGQRVVEGHSLSIERFAAYRTRRVFSPESLAFLRWAVRFGGMAHQGAKSLLRSDAVLDLSAGDSFTDLYGWDRFQSIVQPKRIAIESGVPLILLPQTIGPFQSEKAKDTARWIIRRATQVWARDQDSHSVIQDLVGESDVDQRIYQGVDMAFLLRPNRPAAIPERIQRWLQERDASGPEVIGINVSGLIYNTPEESAAQFMLNANYRKVVLAFLGWLLDTTSARIVLVPHVLTAEGSRESDFDASTAIVGELGEEHRDRLRVLPPNYSASELKHVIGRLDWFCGTRMHSTIAALGSRVPTASLAYSMKTRGVFATCGVEDCVIELRGLGDSDVLDALILAWMKRQSVAARLQRTIPKVLSQANDQMDQIVSAISGHTKDDRTADSFLDEGSSKHRRPVADHVRTDVASLKCEAP